jgi:preprotein translocase subunit SecG
MLLPFAFVFIGVFIVLAIVLILRKSKGKKELNQKVVSKDREEENPPGNTGRE